ncbi:hypothetical protein CORT_0B04930 [Candida orthopsilosis Co 90-125]|uniref:Uncharacterized protein n=1 Tax=Candida orthopsilosis (strain 90-125) TaxID=1136231 RepID=H8X1G1_CANO9|nr:hypothetical protein CORT_0B04930 [Candida orthopsilosis Co 90-125]CCG22201.1 hypothetical protein CORT_0B04930 [Candida orthopsilosis Co 90-125]
MPPQITFINLTKETALPLKIFIKNIPLDPTTSTPNKGSLRNQQSNATKTSTTTTTSLSINEKSPITIHNINQIKLNNAQIEHLVDSISPRIKSLLYYDLHHKQHQQEDQEGLGVNDALLESVNSSGEYFKTTTFNIDNLKVVVPVDVLYQVRYRLGLIEYDEARKHLRDCVFNLVAIDRQPNRQGSTCSVNKNTALSDVGFDDIKNTVGDDVEEGQPKQEKTDDIDGNGYSGHIFNGKSIIGDFATCIKVYVY